jgi:hypothetical protein
MKPDGVSKLRLFQQLPQDDGVRQLLAVGTGSGVPERVQAQEDLVRSYRPGGIPACSAVCRGPGYRETLRRRIRRRFAHQASRSQPASSVAQ